MIDKRRLATSIARRRGRLATFGARAARWYLRSFDNFDYELDTNGEAWLIRRVADLGVGRCWFDVGANVGDWSKRAAATGVTVHAFEIVPSTARQLRAAVPDGVVVNEVGLLDQPGTVKVNHYPDFSAGSGITDYPHGDAQVVECEVTTGDAYCEAHGIDRIGFLKIDVEGVEHRVLAGFDRMLAEARIEVIQFEYGQTSIHTRFLLADFYDLLVPHGYRIGKLHPTWVDFRGYDYGQEDFTGPNYVAARPALAAELGR